MCGMMMSCYVLVKPLYIYMTKPYDPSPDMEESRDEVQDEEEQDEEERDEEERNEGERDEGEQQRQSASASPSDHTSSTPPPTSPSHGRESSLNIRSDTSRGTFDGSEWNTDDDLIKEAGALTKQRPSGSRVAALSEHERWTLKDRSESEQAAWKIIFTALRLDYINEGPPPPDEERDSRLTNDSRLRAIIDSHYREAFSDDSPALEGLEIEAVIFQDRGSLTVGKAVDVELYLKITSHGGPP